MGYDRHRRTYLYLSDHVVSHVPQAASDKGLDGLMQLKDITPF